MTSAAIDILEAANDPELFKSWFRDPSTWRGWFVFLRSVFGLPMSEDDWALFRQCTGRDDRPTRSFTEAWLVVGRRGGKSLMLALIAVFLACFVDWSGYLNRGERGVVLVVAADKKQARVIFRYVRAFLTQTPLLAPLIERETMDTLDLTNGLSIEILAANYRTVRGYSLVAALGRRRCSPCARRASCRSASLRTRCTEGGAQPRERTLSLAARRRSGQLCARKPRKSRSRSRRRSRACWPATSAWWRARLALLRLSPRQLVAFGWRLGPRLSEADEGSSRLVRRLGGADRADRHWRRES
jgi:hypothetical protein